MGRNNYINLCGNHTIQVFPESAFINLVSPRENTYTADSVDQDALILEVPESGSIRISMETEYLGSPDGIPLYRTKYGELKLLDCPFLIDEIFEKELTMIVSLPSLSLARQSGHPAARYMCSPYKVVRLASNTSTVLGCMGFTFQ